MKPKKVRQPPEQFIRKKCFQIIKSSKFINLITCLNLLNIVTFMLYYSRQPALMEDILSKLDFCLKYFISINRLHQYCDYCNLLNRNYF